MLRLTAIYWIEIRVCTATARGQVIRWLSTVGLRAGVPNTRSACGGGAAARTFPEGKRAYAHVSVRIAACPCGKREKFWLTTKGKLWDLSQAVLKVERTFRAVSQAFPRRESYCEERERKTRQQDPSIEGSYS